MFQILHRYFIIQGPIGLEILDTCVHMLMIGLGYSSEHYWTIMVLLPFFFLVCMQGARWGRVESMSALWRIHASLTWCVCSCYMTHELLWHRFLLLAYPCPSAFKYLGFNNIEWLNIKRGSRLSFLICYVYNDVCEMI